MTSTEFTTSEDMKVDHIGKIEFKQVLYSDICMMLTVYSTIEQLEEHDSKNE
jgi:hypothetical protein